MDRIVFTLGVLRTVATAFFLGHSLYWSKILFLTKAVFFFVHRLIEFRKEKKHYYMFEYCYFVNLLAFVYILADLLGYDVANHFPALFGLVYGPLVYGTFVTKDRLYFHSVTHLGSVFMHLAPVLIVWKIRWYDYDTDKEVVSNVLKQSLPLYISWMILYYFTLFVIKRENMYSPDYKSAFIDMSRDPNSFINSVSKSERVREFVFLSVHFILAFITIGLSGFIFNSWIMSTIIPLATFSLSVWNSSKKYCHLLKK